MNITKEYLDERLTQQEALWSSKLDSSEKIQKDFRKEVSRQLDGHDKKLDLIAQKLFNGINYRIERLENASKKRTAIYVTILVALITTLGTVIASMV